MIPKGLQLFFIIAFRFRRRIAAKLDKKMTKKASNAAGAISSFNGFYGKIIVINLHKQKHLNNLGNHSNLFYEA